MDEQQQRGRWITGAGVAVCTFVVGGTIVGSSDTGEAWPGVALLLGCIALLVGIGLRK